MGIKQLEVGKDILLSDIYKCSKTYRNKNYRNVVSCIYMLKNITNDMVYIGCSKDIYKRIKMHRSFARIRKQPIYVALNKYGFDKFYLNIVEECDPKLLSEREVFWIDNLKSKVPYGYNVANGGRGALGLVRYGKSNSFYGKKHSKETKEKMSIKAKNRSESLKKKMLDARRTNGFPQQKTTSALDVETGRVLKVFRSMVEAGNWIKENTIYDRANGSSISYSSKHDTILYEYRWKVEGNG